MDLDRFTRKLGPFPIYVWAIGILAIGYAAYRFLGNRSTATPATADTTPASTDTLAPDGTTNADSSAGIGLASNGNVTPTHIIIDNPAPNLYITTGSPTPVVPPTSTTKPPTITTTTPSGTVAVPATDIHTSTDLLSSGSGGVTATARH